MNLAGLIRRVRVLASDTVKPYLWSDEFITDSLNDADNEAAIRARLLRFTPESNGSLGEISVGAGEAVHELHPAIFEISNQRWQLLGSDIRHPLKLVSREWMDGNDPEWRDLQPDTPMYLVQDASMVQLVPAPDASGTILLEGLHLPLSEMKEDDDEPGIQPAHHVHLVQWPLHLGYSIPDTETFDKNKSERAEKEFTRYFGARPDADLRQSSRKDEEHHNAAWW